MNKPHPNEVIFSKLSMEKMRQLIAQTALLGPKYEEAFLAQGRRQKEYGFDAEIKTGE